MVCHRHCLGVGIMVLKDIRFMGILANVDETSLRLPLEHGFAVEEADFTEVLELIAAIEHTSSKSVLKYFHLDYPCIHNGKLYVITNSVRCNLEFDSSGVVTEFSPEILTFRNKAVQGYLEAYMQKLRLFKEGNICVPLKYYYYTQDERPEPLMCTQTHHPLLCVPFTLEDGDVEGIPAFVGGIGFPFERSYVELAYRNFENSYHTGDENMAFISLMVCLESMYNLDRIDIGQKIRRNAAVFLGEDFEDSTTIYDRMEDLCLKRSRMVHYGELDTVSGDDLEVLRRYARESIKKAVAVNRPKEELFRQLDSQGFPNVRERVPAVPPPEPTGPEP